MCRRSALSVGLMSMRRVRRDRAEQRNRGQKYEEGTDW